MGYYICSIESPENRPELHSEGEAPHILAYDGGVFAYTRAISVPGIYLFRSCKHSAISSQKTDLKEISPSGLFFIFHLVRVSASRL